VPREFIHAGFGYFPQDVDDAGVVFRDLDVDLGVVVVDAEALAEFAVEGGDRDAGRADLADVREVDEAVEADHILAGELVFADDADVQDVGLADDVPLRRRRIALAEGRRGQKRGAQDYR
jgi:hypothetical protein